MRSPVNTPVCPAILRDFFLDRGYVVIAPSYRLAPLTKSPEIVKVYRHLAGIDLDPAVADISYDPPARKTRSRSESEPAG